MNEEQIRDEARKAANRSQFMSNHIYDHKSYEDGFYEGMNQALRQYGAIGSVCPDCLMGRDEFEPEWKCPDCRRQTDL